MATAIYIAPAIHCDGCAASIKRVLGRLPGVEKVEVEVAEKQVKVQFDPSQVSEATIRTRLEMAGFPLGTPEA
jgi:copper chaperone CopZ